MSSNRRNSFASISVPTIFQTTDDDQTPNSNDVDAFEHILEVTKYQEAVIAYYYLDNDNKMRMTQIFDLTNSASSSASALNEQNVDEQLESDSDNEVNQRG